MNRTNMAKQVMEPPMKKCSKTKGAMKKGYMKGGSVKAGYKKGGTVDQSMCSPRKQMAMGKK
jgi:hypothetical protein